MDYDCARPFRVRESNCQPNSVNSIKFTVGYNSNQWAESYVYTGAKTWQATEVDKKGKPKKYDWVPQTIGFVYDFDKEGNKKYEKFVHEGGKGELFRYDSTYRLVGVKYGVQTPENWVNNFDGASYVDKELFNMDNVGNRTSVTNGTTINYTVNNLNQYIAINGAIQRMI